MRHKWHHRRRGLSDNHDAINCCRRGPCDNSRKIERMTQQTFLARRHRWSRRHLSCHQGCRRNLNRCFCDCVGIHKIFTRNGCYCSRSRAVDIPYVSHVVIRHIDVREVDVCDVDLPHVSRTYAIRGNIHVPWPQREPREHRAKAY